MFLSAYNNEFILYYLFSSIMQKLKNIPKGISYLVLGGFLTSIVFVVSVVLVINSESRDTLYDDIYDITTQNYGGEVKQVSPRINALASDSVLYEKYALTEDMAREIIQNTQIQSSFIDTVVYVEYVKRGLIYEPSFITTFSGVYVLKNNSDRESILEFEFPFPVGSNQKEISNAVLIIDGKEISGAKRQKTQTGQVGLYWEGNVMAGQEVEVKVNYETVGLQRFSYEGFENTEDSQDFYFKARIIGTRDYDNIGYLSIDERNYFTEDQNGKNVNGIELVWDKPNLFNTPQVSFLVASKVNPSVKLSSIYGFMTPLFVMFIGTIAGLAVLLKKRFGEIDMVLVSALFTVFFPLLHYLTSFTIDPSAEVFGGLENPINFSMSLYGAFAIALFLIGGIIFYLLTKAVNLRYAILIGIPAIFIFMGFFPLALTIPEYKGLLVLIGLVAILAAIIQIRMSKKISTN